MRRRNFWTNISRKYFAVRNGLRRSLPAQKIFLLKYFSKISTVRNGLRPSLTRERKKLNSQKNGSIFSYRGHFFRIICASILHQEQHKQQLRGHHWLGNITRMMMSLKRNWLMPYLRRNLTQKGLRCGVLIWAALVVRGTKHRETTSM